MDSDESIATREARHKALLGLARQTIAHYLATGELWPYDPEDPVLREPAAVFVTLRERPAAGAPFAEGELRGCIGQVEANDPLYRAVQDAAIKAATVDPRFYPVRAEELSGLLIEVSVLSPFRPVEGLEEIAVGQDGLLIVGERRRGLLLPEVPLAYGWGAQEFVWALCQKAGLPANSWPDRARLYAFTTESFVES